MSSYPQQTPFTNNVGINFHVLMTNWINNPAIMYDRNAKIQDTQARLEKVVEKFKLVRIYNYLTAGWESTGDLSIEGQALVNVMKNNSDVEAVIGTSASISWFLDASNVSTWVSSLQTNLGTAISQVKTILIGNEINANSYTPSDITTILGNFKTALTTAQLSIPVTVSYSNLPDQAGDTNSDNLVAAVMNGWDTSWNGGYPFVFIDPYPDAAGINNAAGVYAWQTGVTNYYRTKYPKIQIFIGETGAEGASDDTSSVPIINDIFAQLESQYSANNGVTVPTIMFEAVDEPLKPASPNQQHMGIFEDNSDPASGSSIALKSGVNLPSWMSSPTLRAM